MNALIIVGLVGIYLISCIGFFRNVAEHPEVVQASASLPMAITFIILALCSLLWPAVIFLSFFFKGLLQ